MSLENPNWLDRLRPHRTQILIGAGLLALLLLVGLVLWMADGIGNWSENRKDREKKQEIVNTVGNIANIQKQISNLEQQKAEERGRLERDVEQHKRDIFGREEAKAATNAALANFNRALSSNSNVDRSAEDLERILRELPE